MSGPSDPLASTQAPQRGLFFWALSPVLLIFVLSMPSLILIQKRDAAAISTLIGLELTGVLMLLGLWNPVRFAWAWRGVGAMVFLAFATYIAFMVIEHKWKPPQRRGEQNLWNAICGMLAFGLPGLWWALLGRIPDPFAFLLIKVRKKNTTLTTSTRIPFHNRMVADAVVYACAVRQSKVARLDAFIASNQEAKDATVDRLGQVTDAAVAEQGVGSGRMEAEDLVVGSAIVGPPRAIGGAVFRRLVAVDE